MVNVPTAAQSGTMPLFLLKLAELVPMTAIIAPAMDFAFPVVRL